VLSLAGYCAEPYARDRLVARDICDGAVSGDTAHRLTPDGTKLDHSEAHRYDGLGTYTCSLDAAADDEHDEGWTVFGMRAYTRRDDQDALFRRVFDGLRNDGYVRYTPLPGGLPGMVSADRLVVLQVPCPDLGKDAEGRARQLVTRTAFHDDATTGVPGAAYRTAVEFTNSASHKLGCGTPKVPTPPAVDRGRLTDPGRADDEEPRAPVRGAGRTTPCGRLAAAGIPDPRGWSTYGRPGGAKALLATCDMSRTVPGSESPAGVTTQAWYGEWSNRFVSDEDTGVRLPFTASVNCGGVTANFRLQASRTLTRAQLGTSARRKLFELFVADQLRRHDGCDAKPRFTY
jgi:hypothetical protein